MTMYLPLSVQRNARYRREWAFTTADGEPVDLTGATFEMDVKYAADPGEPVLGSATITIADAVAGRITVDLDGAAIDADGAQEVVRLAYDLIAVQGGTRMVLARGPLDLVPGVS